MKTEQFTSSDEEGKTNPSSPAILLICSPMPVSCSAASFMPVYASAASPLQPGRVLATLSDGDGMTVGELARIALANQPTMTKNIDKLEKAGLVERRGDEGDGAKR